MRRIAALSSLLLILFGPVARGGEDEARSAERRQPTYESPILSLLLLPVNVLFKVASLFGGEEPAKTERPTAAEPPAGERARPGG